MSGATVVVAADGSGDFATLGAAVQAVAWADAAAVGSLLHYGKTDVPALKNALRAAGVEVRRCDPL